MILAKERFGLRGRAMGASQDIPEGMHFIPFSAQTRISGVNFDGTSIRKGASDVMTALIQSSGNIVPPDLQPAVERIATREARRSLSRGTVMRWGSYT